MGGSSALFHVAGIGHGGGLDRELEIGPDAHLALQPDRAAEHFAEPVTDRQPQPRAAVFAADGGIDLAERPEKPVQFFLGNPLARVANGEMEHPRINRADVAVIFHVLGELVPGHDQVHPSAGGRELHRIGNEVEKDLPHARHVADEHLRDARIDLAAQRHPPGGRLHREQIDDLLQARPQRERLVVQFQATRLDLGKIQRVVDQAQEVVAAGGDQPHEFFLVGLQGRVEQQARHADDAVDGRANLVAHHRQKIRLDLRGLERLVARLGLRGGGVFLGGDVVDGALVVRESARRIADGVDALANPGRGAVAAVDFALEIRHPPVLMQMVDHVGAPTRRDLPGAPEIVHFLHELGGRIVTVKPGRRRVGVDVAALGVHLENALRHVFEDAAIIFLRPAQPTERLVEFGGGQLRFGHLGHVAQGEPLLVAEGVALGIGDAKRAERVALGREQRLTGVKAQVHLARHERVVMETRVAARVVDDERFLRVEDRVRAKRKTPLDLFHVKALTGFVPHTILVHQGDVGNRHAEQLGGQPGDAVEPLLRRGVEDVKRPQRGEALGFAVQRGWRDHGWDDTASGSSSTGTGSVFDVPAVRASPMEPFNT